MRLPRNGDLLPTPQQDISVSPGHRHTFDGRRSNAVLCLVFVIQIEPPLLRLGDAFDLRTTFHEEGLETLPRKDSAQGAPSARESNLVSYPGPVVHGREVVFMHEVSKGAGYHHIAKVAIGAQLVDPACMP